MLHVRKISKSHQSLLLMFIHSINNFYILQFLLYFFIFQFTEPASQSLSQPEEDWDYAQLVLRAECKLSLIAEIQRAVCVRKMFNQ